MTWTDPFVLAAPLSALVGLVLVWFLLRPALVGR